jgi:hypothetical protein
MKKTLSASTRRLMFSRCFFLCLLSFIVHSALLAQLFDPPVCSSLKIGQATGMPGETVCVDFSANIPYEMVAMQFIVTYDTTDVEFDHLEFGANTPLYLTAGGNFNAGTAGIIKFSWSDPAAYGVMLPPGILIFRLCLRIKPGAAAGFSPVEFSLDSSPVPFMLVAAVIDPDLLPQNLIFGGIAIGVSPAGPVLEQICTKKAGCSGPAIGFINLTVSGGAPPYQFSWANETGAIVGTMKDLSDISAGHYKVTVTDQNGGSAVALAEVLTGGYSMVFSNWQIQHDTCGAGKGSITVNIAGGTPPYAYQWSPLTAGSTTLANITAGHYDLTVTDATNCIITNDFTVTNISNLDAAVVLQLPDCNAALPNGRIELTPSGGTQPYAFQWSAPGNSGAIINDLPAGSYAVTISDANGCSKAMTFPLSHLQASDWAVMPQSDCGAGAGQLILSVASVPMPSWPLSVLWSNGASHSIQGNGATVVEDTLSGLPDGKYEAQIIDANGCVYFTGDIEIDCTTQQAFNGKSCLNFRIGSLPALAGETVCLPVQAVSFTGVQHFSLYLEWDATALTFNGINGQAIDLPDLQYDQHDGNRIDIIWSKPLQTGFTVPDGTTLFDLCFIIEANATPGPAAVHFGWPDNYSGPGLAVLKTAKQVGITGFGGGGLVGGGIPQTLFANACGTAPGCDEDGLSTLQMSVAGGMAPYAAMWRSALGSNSTIYSGQAGDIRFLRPGGYLITITDQNGLSATAAYRYVPETMSSECIWPGDADNNNAVNHFDLLFIAYGQGATGPIRSDTGISWAGRNAPGWGSSMPFNYLKYDNLDCDGNGQINASDTLALVQNWGNVVRPGYDNPFQYPSGLPYNLYNGFNVFVQPDTIAGNTVLLNLHAGTPNWPVYHLLGLAFSVYYDTAVVQPDGVYFEPGISWMGDPATSILWVQHNFPQAGRLDIALARRGNIPANGYGPIGTLHGLVWPDVFVQKPESGKKGTDTSVIAHFRIDHVLAMGEGATFSPVYGSDTAVVFIQSPINPVNDVQNAFTISLAPNPANTYTIVNSAEIPVTKITLRNNLGTAVRDMHPNGMNTFIIDTADLLQGFYLLEVHTQGGTRCLKLVVGK